MTRNPETSTPIVRVAETQSDSMRRRIALAAYELIGEGGWEKATMRAIAAHAGVSLGLVQHYFGTKEATLRWALQMGMEVTMEEFKTIAESRGTASTRLAKLLVHLLPEAPRQQHLWRFWIALWGRAAFNEAIRREHGKAYVEYRRGFSELIADALIEARHDPAAAAVAARDLVALLDGCGLQGALGDPEMTPTEVYAACRRYLTFVGVKLPRRRTSNR